VIERQHAIVRQLRPTSAKLESAGIRVVAGDARFADAHTIAVGTRRLRASKIVIAAGSAPVVPPLPGAELAITSDDLLFLPDFPATLTMVGAGAIGLELGAALNDLGAAVTVVAREDEILAGFDPDVAGYLRTILEARGMTFHRSASVTALRGRPGDVVTEFETAGGVREVRARTVCLAVGRRWSPAMLGAEDLGLATSRLGLATSPHLRTSIGHIYAAGDAAGNVQLTPTAALEGRVAARNALEGDRAMADLTVVAQAIFTTPEIARVGLGHREALARGVACHVSRHDMRGASNGVATGEDAGYLKLVFDASERVLGVQMVSYAASELIQLAALAIRCGATASMLAAQLAIHPSQAERFIKFAAHEFHDVCEV
jgi:glutathione reductase (NADPH)